VQPEDRPTTPFRAVSYETTRITLIAHHGTMSANARRATCCELVLGDMP
jgi:hypothetical protein